MYIAKAQRVREKKQVFQKQQFGLKLLYVRRLVWSTFWSRAPFCCLVSAGPMLQWLAPRVVYFVFDFRTCDLVLSFFVQKGSFVDFLFPGSVLRLGRGAAFARARWSQAGRSIFLICALAI
jgi:hypothetical protein